MGQNYGFVALGDTLPIVAVMRDSQRQPANPSATPGFRVYGPGGLMSNGTGNLSQAETGSVIGATNATPIVIQSTGHGLTTGTRVTVAGVGGTTNANTTTTVTVVDADHFSLDGTTGNGAYTSGGTWNVSGVYSGSLQVLASNGYVSGQSYSLLVTGTVGGNVDCEEYTFTVV